MGADFKGFNFEQPRVAEDSQVGPNMVAHLHVGTAAIQAFNLWRGYLDDALMSLNFLPDTRNVAASWVIAVERTFTLNFPLEVNGHNSIIAIRPDLNLEYLTCWHATTTPMCTYFTLAAGRNGFHLLGRWGQRGQVLCMKQGTFACHAEAHAVPEGHGTWSC